MAVSISRVTSKMDQQSWVIPFTGQWAKLERTSAKSALALKWYQE